jgi:plasmid stabilization system protein ParE
MKKSITRTPQSEEDAYETYRYIALDSVDAAEAYFDALFDTFDKLLEHPKLGAVVEEAEGELRGLRLIPVSSKFRKHLVFYLPKVKSIHIVRILHSSRDIEPLFAEE